MDNDLAAVWMLALIHAENKLDAVCIRMAISLGISPGRYNEITKSVIQIVESTSCPTEFWNVVDERRKPLFLNDSESVLFGAMMCNVITCMRNSVYFGKKLAIVNNVDYDKIISYRKERVINGVE